MTKSLVRLLALFISLTLFSACTVTPAIQGSDNVIETDYTLSGFSQLDISSAFTAEVYQTDEFKVVVECNDNLMDYLEVELNGETLHVGLANGNTYKNTKLSVKVYLPSLERIRTSGACTLNLHELEGDDLEIRMSGASSVLGQLDISHDLDIKASGATEFALGGTTSNANLKFSGAAKFHGKDLVVADHLNVSSSGASKIEITTNGVVDLNLSGASHFIYYGTGVIQSKKTSGASVVKQK